MVPLGLFLPLEAGSGDVAAGVSAVGLKGEV